MKKIALIGAFDRDNYGDILMPIVFEEYMNKFHSDFYSNLTFKYYGLKESNMQYLGGKNTISLSSINMEIDDMLALVLVGGAILPCRYGDMFIHLQENPKLIKCYKILDKFIRPLFDLYCKNKLNGKNIRPWLIDQFDNKIIIYNTVGGSLTKRKLLLCKKKIINALNKASYISVRDIKTKYYLDRNSIENRLYPDSVVILSKIISDEMIMKNVGKEKQHQVKKLGKYIVIQMNAKVGLSLVNEIKEEIEKLYDKYKISCVLLPIGRAPGHEDQLPLQQLDEQLSTPHYMPETNNVFETIYLIKNAVMYCGTSLHGAITSISYCIPHTALTNKIPKLNAFLNTWNTTPIKNTEPKQLIETYEQLLKVENLKETMISKRDELQKLAIENFENINEIIKKSDFYEKEKLN